jgi:hypothetical protein
MKRHLVLEYRIRKLEKVILEDMDSDLDKMSDDILKKNPYIDLYDELDNKASSLVDKPIKSRYETINDWVDSIVFINQTYAKSKAPGLKIAIHALRGMLRDMTSCSGGLDFGLHRAAEIKNYIGELRNTNVLIANQKMVSALRKKIKELELELKDIKNKKSPESLTYEGKKDQEVLNDFLGDDYYDRYLSIKNKISDPEYKDIYKLIKKDPDEVKNYIDNFKSNRNSIKAAKEGARKVYEDSDWIVYHITNYDAAKYYGRDTKWCLSGNYEGLEEVGQHEFKKYNSKNNIYFYINKHKAREKYAMLKNRYTDRITDVYDSADNNLGNSAYYINIELPYVEEIGYNTVSQLELYDAIKEGDLDQVKDCFSKDFVNMKDHRGVTLLMIAIMRSFEDIAEFLIKNGANVNAQNNAGATPLMYACFENNLNMVKLLVKYGADVNAKTKYGTPLTSTDDEDIEEYLISKGAKVN